MLGTSVLVNGKLASPEALVFRLDDTDITYGYGCYETLKVREGLLYFAELHAQRLLASAALLGIRHSLETAMILRGLKTLVAANGLSDCNLKLMLIGHEGRDAEWYAFALPALAPPPGAEAEGVDCLVVSGERHFPQAKSLSMLLSTVAFRAASAQGCWDALLVNRRGEVTEGTRTNVFFYETSAPGRLYTPPATDCLAGITRHTLREALSERGIVVEESPLPLGLVRSGTLTLLVTSTSSRVLPVRRILAEGLAPFALPQSAWSAEIEALYATYLARYAANLRQRPNKD